MKIHNNSAHGDHKYTCGICGHQKSRKKDLTQHYEAKHQGNKYQCMECDYQTTFKSGLAGHQNAIHDCVKGVYIFTKSLKYIICIKYILYIQ